MNENSYANDPFRFMITMSHRPYQMIICIYLFLTFQCLIEKLTLHISSNNCRQRRGKPERWRFNKSPLIADKRRRR